MAHPFRRKAAADMIGDTRPSWHLHRYLQGSANLFEENRLLKVAIAGLFGITAVLGTLIYTLSHPLIFEMTWVGKDDSAFPCRREIRIS